MYKVCLTSFSNEYAKDVIVTWVASSVKMFFAVLFTTLKISEPKQQLLTVVKLIPVCQYKSTNMELEGWLIN